MRARPPFISDTKNEEGRSNNFQNQKAPYRQAADTQKLASSPKWHCCLTEARLRCAARLRGGQIISPSAVARIERLGQGRHLPDTPNAFEAAKAKPLHQINHSIA